MCDELESGEDVEVSDRTSPLWVENDRYFYFIDLFSLRIAFQHLPCNRTGTLRQSRSQTIDRSSEKEWGRLALRRYIFDSKIIVSLCSMNVCPRKVKRRIESQDIFLEIILASAQSSSLRASDFLPQ